MSTMQMIGAVIAAAGGSAVVIGGIAAWVGSFLSKRIADYRNLEFSIDQDLRERRLPVYQQLWTLTSVLPMWPHASGIRYGDIQKLSEDLRDWYFKTGGHLLSQNTHREAYSPLQGSLAELSQEPDEKVISDDDYEQIRERCSNLRTHLSRDIQSRRESPFA